MALPKLSGLHGNRTNATGGRQTRVEQKGCHSPRDFRGNLALTGLDFPRRFSGDRSRVNRSADDQGGSDEHEVLHDVLAFHREHKREALEATLRQDHQGQKGPRHLEKQQQETDAQQRSEQEAKADRHFPPPEDRKKNIGWKPVDRPAHEIVGRTGVEGFQRPEPNENYGEGVAENTAAITVHPRGNRFIPALKASGGGRGEGENAVAHKLWLRADRAGFARFDS